MPVTIPQGHVALVLFREGDQTFYLHIPLNIIDSLCLRPRKYLLYLGWCILGSEGTVQHDGIEIGADGNLDDQGIYHYIPNEALNLARAVDVEVIKTRSNDASESEQTHGDFRTKLLQRDVCCVWTGHNANLGVGLHIIPYEQGSEWFRLIVLNRPRNGENITTLKDINDTRNGVFANLYIHQYFNQRLVAVLRTPNSILQTDDIPPRLDRDLHADVSYPTGRYTLQWLEAQDQAVASAIPNNVDAAFKKNTRMFKPSDLLLHYNYGAAAVKRWGRGTEILQNRLKGLRPSKPVPAPAGPSKHGGTVANHKRGVARNRGGASAGNAAGAGIGSVESEGQAKWDEDDIMLFFWGNSKVATERHLKKVGENAQRIEQWRGGVPRDSV